MKILLASLTHHSDPADPDLIDWVLEWFNLLVGGNSLIIIVLILAIIFLIPISVLLFYRLFDKAGAGE